MAARSQTTAALAARYELKAASFASFASLNPGYCRFPTGPGKKRRVLEVVGAESLAGNSFQTSKINSNAKLKLVVCCAILLASSIIIPMSAVGFPDVEPVPSLFVEVLLGSIITAAASLAGNPLASNSNAKLRLSSFVLNVPRTFRGAANANSFLFLMPKLPLGRRPPLFFFLRTPELFFFFLGPFSIFIGGLSRVVEELDDEELDREELDDVCNTGLLNHWLLFAISSIACFLSLASL